MKFIDSKNRTWSLALTVAGLKRVRQLCDVDLAKSIEKDCEVLARIASDPALLVDVAYAIIKPEAERVGVSDTDFGESISGDSIPLLMDSLMEGISSFFTTKESLLIRKLIEKTRKIREIQNRNLDEAIQRADQVDPEEVYAAMMSGKQSTDARA